MLISWAILSLVAAVGVGFLLNSTSSVTSWSCVARWRFWFFCCWVRVLFRGGLRGAEPCVGVETEGVGEAMVVSSGDCMAAVFDGALSGVGREGATGWSSINCRKAS